MAWLDGTTTSRLWQNMEARLDLRVINVKSPIFGAVGDGVTDDTSAWQAALNAVAAIGGCLVVPAGVYLIPNGGLTCSTSALKILALAGVSQDTPASKGAILKMTASTGALLSLSGPGAHVDGITFTHTGTATTCVGLAMTNCNYTRTENCTFENFGTNLTLDTGGYYSIRACAFRNAQVTNIDIQNTASADFGVMTVEACTFIRDDTVTGGAAVTYRTGGGLRFLNNGIEGSFTHPFDYGIRTLVPDGKIMSVLQVIGNTIEQFQVAGISVEIANVSGQISNSVVIVGNEINSLTFGGTGIFFGVPATSSVIINGNSIFLCDTGMFVNNVSHVAIDGNSITSCTTAGIHLGSNMRDCNVGDGNAVDMVLGGKDYVNDGPRLATWARFTKKLYFGTISDTADHDLFEIGINGDAYTFDLELGAHQNGGGGAIVRRLSRQVVATGGDSTISTIGTDLATSGSVTITVTGTGLGGPVQVKVTRVAGTNIAGQLIVTVQGEGFAYFKTLLRNN